jgi:hypothetical protein
MAFVPFVTAQMLCDTLSQTTYMAIFDDTNSNLRATVDASTPVVLLLNRAHALTISWLPGIYKTLPAEPPATAPYLLVSAELDMAVCLAYRRHPEFVRTYSAEPGGKLVQEWVEMMKRVQIAEQEIAPNDNPPEAKPENTGGKVESGDPANPVPVAKFFANGTTDF